MGSQIVNWRQIAVCSVITLGLAGCANDNNQAAPISSVGDNGAGSRSGSTTTYSSPPPRISSVGSASNNTQPAPSAGISRPSSDAAVTNHEGKIVYNRSYNSIPKGSYSGNNYTVKRGDTLFYIAWITGNDYRELAQRNNIQEPYSLNVGQSLSLGSNMNAGGSTQGMAIAGTPATVTTSAPVESSPASNGHMLPENTAKTSGGGRMLSSGNANGNSGHMLPANAAAASAAPLSSSAQMQTTQVDSQPSNAYSEGSGKQNVGKMLPTAGAATTLPTTEPTQTNTAIASWRWPTDGKVIDNFSASEGGNKGIDIAGSRGQSVIATASGRVVYAGNALRGYGNLIIIKHNDDYLSAYAHNETMLVREQQEVKAGQQIATMGSTGTSSVRLHFEIRYKGKSVNPLRFLPQR
ncbi:murein hydrolase activator NlpD [Dickeya solani]|uniref:Murein hydrolase activator NlpD n=1 Tax=Dickeya solani TaxID=1089444 RepID=A0ABU4EK58_9GAMM|nr:murein hydrolase activator NlpD [Dickeya solani]MCA7000120.1 murein hydrolase activator NlpD [Dickeya solani]MCZ0823575.1 murein hydrolase activator NlpD [Dickeya solani]MDV6994308.1 murein hydrolase activator NlpD [Dickeya solani]MDV7005708.1 murein hydrolase activator NlpD [Dickeya solani]MDV7038141.1 murein hydrolase activator NlpD [Dickeya solani]